MQTKTLIQAQANVMKITSLKIGDVFKLVDTTYSNPKICFGVVLDLLNTGNKAYIQLLLYKRIYSNSAETEIRTIEGESDIALFPARLDEIQEDFRCCIESLKKNIETKKQELQEAIDACEKTKQFISGEMSKQLSEMSYQTITQEQFDAQKKLTDSNAGVQG